MRKINDMNLPTLPLTMVSRDILLKHSFFKSSGILLLLDVPSNKHEQHFGESVVCTFLRNMNLPLRAASLL